MFKVFIKAEGGSDKGYGHIMRCISLARELSKNEFEILFLINCDNGMSNLLNSCRLNFQVIKSKRLLEEIKEIEYLINDRSKSIVITDSYWISNEYLNGLKEIFKYVISIDDLNLYDYPSHMLINSNVYANDIQYKNINNTKYLLGGKYAIFRDEFIDCKPIDVVRKCSNILVTMGGSDLNNYTLNIIEYLKDMKDIKLNVVIGPGFKNIESIVEASNKLENINLIYSPNNMKDIMIKNDIAISSASTTSYELALLGIPSILIIQVENQVMVANKMDELGAAINLGWFFDINKKKLLSECEDLILDYERRKNMSRISKNIVCGDGVKNIVKKIIELVKYE